VHQDRAACTHGVCHTLHCPFLWVEWTEMRHVSIILWATSVCKVDAGTFMLPPPPPLADAHMDVCAEGETELVLTEKAIS
jgi:hypothetical protein